MSIWRDGDPENLSGLAMRDAEGGGEYPCLLSHKNTDVVRIAHVLPGILEVESRHDRGDTLVLTGGIHGDEKAGIVILDRLIHEIREGKIPVARSLLLMYGNLMAMKANDGNGLRCVEPEIGPTSNLNRCFNRGFFESPRGYAEKRANQMMERAEAVLAGRVVEAIDIHQSFGVPTVSDVRPNGDRTEYTYAMLYPNKVEDTLEWVYYYFSDIVAGGVLNNMVNRTHNTWAGYMASQYGAHAATFEQGTIGHTDHVTFTPQLYANLVSSIGGNGRLKNPEGFDVWRCVRGITRQTRDFAFLDRAGEPLNRAPRDFISPGYSHIAQDGDVIHRLKDDERLLFANAKVPLGDRAAEVIVPFHTELVPRP